MELVASFVHRSNLLKSWDKTDIRQGRRSGACGQKTPRARAFSPMCCHGAARIVLTAPRSSDAVALHRGACEQRLRDGKLPSNFPRSERRGTPAIDGFYVDELVTKPPSFPLQIGQHPVTVLLFIGLLARIHLVGWQSSIDRLPYWQSRQKQRALCLKTVKRTLSKH